MKKTNVLLTYIISLLFIAGCIFENENEYDINIDKIKIGDSIPDFKVRCNDGTYFYSNDVKKSKCTLICFFNTKCPDCRNELKILQNIYEDNKLPARILCISRSENELSVQKYWESNHITLPYSAQTDSYIYNLFALQTIPRIYVFDKFGIVRAIYTDSPIANKEELIRTIYSVINETSQV